MVKEDGQNYIEIMNIGQIRKAWNQGAAKGASGAHINFTDEMAKKTVINRACKLFFNTSDDSDLLIDAFNKTDDKTAEDKDLVNDVDYEVKEEIKDKANIKPIDIKDEVASTSEKAKTNTNAIKEQLELDNHVCAGEGPGF